VADPRLFRHSHGRDRSTETFVARREQDVPYQRINRCPCDDANPIELLVERSDNPEVNAHHKNDSRLQERSCKAFGNLGSRNLIVDTRLG
jgi:hypothetical protein